MKRRRAPKAKPGQLIAFYGRIPGDGMEADDLCFSWGGEGASKPDGRLLSSAFSTKVMGDNDLCQELKERGYDLSTMRFTISRCKPPA